MESIFRVLGENEKLMFDRYGILYCNEVLDNYGYFNRNYHAVSKELNSVIGHVLHGNRFNSSWISCSKSLEIALEKYSLPTPEGHNKIRPFVAIINNHSNNSLITDIPEHHGVDILKMWTELLEKDLILSQQYTKIFDQIKNKSVTKLVIDYSNPHLVENMCLQGIIRKQDGGITNGKGLATNYGTSSEEVLVFRNIPERNIENSRLSSYSFLHHNSKNIHPKFCNIPAILSPIDYDVIYALFQNQSVNNDDSSIKLWVIKNTLDKCDFEKIFDTTELKMYQHHYEKRYSLNYIIELSGCETLERESLYNEFLNLKRKMIMKLISYCNSVNHENYNNRNILLLEEKCEVKPFYKSLKI